MARYIDADKLIEYIKSIPTWHEVLHTGWRPTKYPDGMYYCDEIISAIDKYPAEKLFEQKDIEIQILIRKKEALRDEIAEQQAEIKKLKHEIALRDDIIYDLIGDDMCKCNVVHKKRSDT